MARARSALVALALVLGLAALWFLCARDSDENFVAPPGRSEPRTPAAPVLEGHAGTDGERARIRARLAEDGGTPTTPAQGGAEDAATIEGTVTGWDGKPMAGIALFLVRADEPAPPRVKGELWRTEPANPQANTDEAGYYRTGAVAEDWAGVVVARVSSTYEVRSAPVRAGAERQRVDFALPPPATLRVRLASASGERLRLKQLTVKGEYVWYALRRDEGDPWGFREEEEGSAVTVRGTPGRVTVQAWIDGGPMVEREAELVSGKTVEVEMVAPSDGVVRGRVLYPAEWRLLHASLMWDGDRTVFGHVDDEGEFRLAGTGRGRGRLHVGAFTDPAGHVEVELEDVLPDSGVLEVRLERKAPSIITGHTLGLGDADTVVTQLLSRSTTSGWHLHADQDGRFEEPVTPKEPSLLVLQVRDMAPVLIDLPVMAAGERRDVGLLRFGPGIELVGRVRTGDDLPVARVEVAVAERWAQETGVPAVTTDEQGTFRLPHMPDRPLLLRFRGGRFPQHLVTVDPAQTPKPEIVLRPGGIAALQVVDAAGRGVAGADVTAFPVGDFPYDGDFDTTRRSLTVDAEGKVRTRICAGPRRFRAYADDGRTSEDVLATFREGETTEVTLVLREKAAK